MHQVFGLERNGGARQRRNFVHHSFVTVDFRAATAEARLRSANRDLFGQHGGLAGGSQGNSQGSDFAILDIAIDGDRLFDDAV